MVMELVMTGTLLLLSSKDLLGVFAVVPVLTLLFLP
jgi:hypothetical protein